LRPHDLRHSYAAQLASAGFSLHVIGALLSHQSPTVTAKYSHLFDDTLRQATERAGQLIAGDKSRSAAVLRLKGRSK
jgi:site-specific recombinase XerD